MIKWYSRLISRRRRDSVRDIFILITLRESALKRNPYHKQDKPFYKKGQNTIRKILSILLRERKLVDDIIRNTGINFN